ncbi:MAG TPA: methyltransferase domain-containing protein [Burkholderiales bacterium]|nr:methyltransferase domain-containing protein [Betaproteobacteria bacterium]HQR52197.1 methyltransferase domain-containing protein [Burkholderiales bacterium]
MRAWIYDQTFVGLTVGWYREVLKRLPRGARLLDVGIGTGGALVRNAALVRSRDLHIVGVDIDGVYLRRCRKLVGETGLGRYVTPLLESVYDHRGGPYDAIYFSASFMLLPDPVGALRHAAQMLAPGGRIYFTQTIHTKRAPVMEKVKPLLHRLTTIHFGRVTYEHELVEVVGRSGLHLHEWHNLGGTRDLRFCLAMAKRPARGVENDLPAPVAARAAVA